MKKNYNNKRQKLFLPEYGRHIQEMVDSLLLIEDRRERNRQARAVIAVMGNLNPLLRDTAEFNHKLWDHMFIMSDFKLDVDSPYPPVTRESLTIRPKKMRYPSNQIMYKHYGKSVERMIRSLEHQTNPVIVANTIDNIARYMRAKSYEYNELKIRKKITNARGQIRQIFHDAMGRITGYTSPEGSVSYTYDDNGNVLTVTDNKGTITRTYDALNRVSRYTDTYVHCNQSEQL